ncbi:hypothetical protein [Sandaracinus amylolyticus]|uniref:Uncharacterized protein n=1 Tax=Sandaracinus amylolyticus TaxID=927083 RepID=A0A0F6SEU4_9BACT|nr:hypothetical protein [Sandaracinus amylolyticus]AKF05799.1 hypothetical protein DB32_002948 [Sandaracinus amylolyticus]
MLQAERRIHKVFVTRNTEYHVRRDVCVAVRDRRSGEWLRGHLALRQRVHGGLKFTRAGGILPNLGQPGVGESIFFHAGGRDLVTSPVLSVERPEKRVVSTYPATR